jgi:glutaconate CoA-transferase subunit B
LPETVTLGFSAREAAVITAARFIKDGDVIMVGQGLPVLVALFAKKNHAKGCVIMHEYGVVDLDPPRAVELAHPLLAETATYLCDMLDALTSLLYRVDCAFLGAAQVDRFGNVNTTTIGNYFKPKVRISGSGGANDIGSIAPKSVIIMDGQDKSKFPATVDYNTTPGYFKGSRRERERLGLPGQGPEAVVTDVGVYRFAPKTGEMYLSALQPAAEVEEAKEKTGWNLKVAKKLANVKPPTPEETRLLRSLDPRRIYLR